MAPGRVDGDILGDFQKPRPETRWVFQVCNRPKRQEKRLLDQVLGAMRVPGFEIKAREQKLRRAPHQLLEGGTVTVPGASDQCFFRLGHVWSSVNSDGEASENARTGGLKHETAKTANLLAALKPSI